MTTMTVSQEKRQKKEHLAKRQTVLTEQNRTKETREKGLGA